MTTSPEHEGIDTLWRVIWSYLHQNTPPRAADHSQQSIDLARLVRESDWLAQVRADERRKVDAEWVDFARDATGIYVTGVNEAREAVAQSIHQLTQALVAATGAAARIAREHAASDREADG